MNKFYLLSDDNVTQIINIDKIVRIYCDVEIHGIVIYEFENGLTRYIDCGDHETAIKYVMERLEEFNKS